MPESFHPYEQEFLYDLPAGELCAWGCRNKILCEPVTLKRSLILQVSALFSNAVVLEYGTGLCEAFSGELQWTKKALYLSTSIYPSAKWRGSVFQSILSSTDNESYCESVIVNKNFQTTLLVILHATLMISDYCCHTVFVFLHMYEFVIFSPRWWTFPLFSLFLNQEQRILFMEVWNFLAGWHF